MYISNKPTKERKNFYSFMESNKKHGVVGTSKVKEYSDKKGYSISTYSPFELRGSPMWISDVKHKGKLIAQVGNRKNKQISWWSVR